MTKGAILRRSLPLLAALLAAAAAAVVFSPSFPQLSAGEPLPAPRWIGLYDMKGKVGLKWIHDSRFETIRVFRRSKGEKAPFDLVGEVRTGQFVDQGVQGEGAYEYYLIATDGGGQESRRSAVRSIRVEAVIVKAVSPPLWEGYLFTEEGVGLKWQSRDRENILAFNIYRKFPLDQQFQLVGSTAVTNYHDRNLEPGRTYLYALSALDRNFRESALSRDLEVTVPVRAAEPEKDAMEIPWRYLRTKLVKIVTKGETPFFRPADVAVGPRTGRIYVTDTGNARLQVFTAGGDFLSSHGGRGEDGVSILGRPIGVAVAADESVYVVDASQSSVAIMSPDGSFRRWVGLTRFFSNTRMGLVDAAVTAAGKVFVVDNYNNRISIVGDEGLDRFFGEPGFQPGRLSAPTFCAIDGENFFYLSDALNGRVQVFEPSGRFVRAFGEYRQGPGGLARPKGIAVAPDGDVFVADSWQNTVQVFNSEGRFTALLADEAGGPLDLGSPNGIALGPPNLIYIVERLANRLQIREIIDER